MRQQQFDRSSFENSQLSDNFMRDIELESRNIPFKASWVFLERQPNQGYVSIIVEKECGQEKNHTRVANACHQLREVKLQIKSESLFIPIEMKDEINVYRHKRLLLAFSSELY